MYKIIMQSAATGTPKKYIINKSKDKASDFCRCCKVSLRIKYGDNWKSVSSVNLFQKSSRQGFEDNKLSKLIQEQTGFFSERSPTLSERLCKTCALKIKKTCEGLFFIRKTLNVPHPKFEENDDAAADADNPAIEIRMKRSLPTPVSTPERSPRQKKIARNETGRPAKKSLQFDAKHPDVKSGQSDETNTSSSSNDDDSRLFNTDDLCVCAKKARVKVLIQWPNGRTDVCTPSTEERESINLIKNLALKKWEAVSNAVWKHPQLYNRKCCDPFGG